MIRGLLFDKDGTLFDFHKTWGAWTATFLLQLAHGDEAAAARIGDALGYNYATGVFERTSLVIASTPAVLAREFVRVAPDWGEAEVLEHMNLATMSVQQHPAVPLQPLLSGFRAVGYRMGISTNDAEAPARAHLEAHDLVRFFEFIAGFDSGFGPKPAPGMQFAFCEVTELDPGEVAMIGDSTHDLDAGKAAGMLRIGVLTGIASKEELLDHADIVLADIGEIPAYLQTLAV